MGARTKTHLTFRRHNNYTKLLGIKVCDETKANNFLLTTYYSCICICIYVCMSVFMY